MPANDSSSASRGSPLTACLVPHLAQQTLEPLFGRVVDERHCSRDARMYLGDRAAHLVRDRSIRGMPLVARPELDQMECLGGIEVESVTGGAGERGRVG